MLRGLAKVTSEMALLETVKRWALSTCVYACAHGSTHVSALLGLSSPSGISCSHLGMQWKP
jgi:hypothetical protein